VRAGRGDRPIAQANADRAERHRRPPRQGAEQQAQGAQQFKQRFGDNNMKAYQQAWNANAKSEIFEAMNLSKEIDNPEQLKKELDKLFPSKAKHEEFLKNYRNLKRLSETGTQ
jgi:hypothetical protein